MSKAELVAKEITLTEAVAEIGTKLQQLAQDKVDAEQEALHKLADEMYGVEKQRVSMEEFANSESPVWRNVDYSDNETKNSIMQDTHNAMVAEGTVVKVSDEIADTVDQAYPDLRNMKKKERTPILKAAMTKLKNDIRQFLNGFKNQTFEFEVNGKVLDATLYNTGINEVLEKVTKEKANMLYSTEDIFRNARYLYSTQDYAGDSNVYRWNYFYTPVQIGNETVGVRIAVRDMVKGTDGASPESQIYNWGIKKDASLDGGSHDPRAASSDVSSDASTNNICQIMPGVNREISSTEGQVLRGSDAVQIADVESAGGGKLTVKLTDGSTADISELSFPNMGEQELWRVLAEYSEDAEHARQLLKEYRAGNLGAFEYAKGVEEAFLYGKLNISEGEMSQRGSYVNMLNPMQKNMAYKYGQFAGEKQTKRQQANVNAVYEQAQSVLQQNGITQKPTQQAVTVDGISVENMNRSQRLSFKMAEMIAPGIQCKIEVYNGGKEWGFYNPRTDTIRLNINAKWSRTTMLAFTLGHEMAHRAKRGSPAQFDAFAAFLVQKYGEQGSSVKDMIAQQLEIAAEYDKTVPKEQRLNMTDEMALEEVVADACQRMLLDTNAGQRLAEFGAQSQQNRDFLQKFGEILRKLLKRLRSIFKNVEPDSLAAQEFMRFDANTKQILADMFVDMSIDAGEKLSTIKAAGLTEKITTEDGSVKSKRSVGYDYSKSFAEQIDDFKKGKFPALDTFIVCGTPAIYQKIGFNALPMTINRTHVDYALNGTKNAEHLIGEKMLKQLPNALNKPIAVIVSRTAPSTSVVVIVSLKHNGEQVIAPVYLDGAGRQNGISIDSNAITSVHGRSNAITGLLNNALKEEANGNIGVFYWDKKTATALMTTSGVTMPQRLSLHDGYIHSIREIGSPVNMKFNDVTETQQFKRWFGDWMKHPDKASKVVNQDGTPMVVYHGSADQFNTFSYGHIGSASGASILRDGFYFTDKKELGKNYGKNLYECYLQMKKPYYATESDAYKLNTKKLVAQGYDGVILKSPSGNVYMVFQNTQIKSATDNIGTFDGSNPDIRYKLPVSKDIADEKSGVRQKAGRTQNTPYRKPAYDEWDVSVALDDALDHTDQHNDNLIKVGNMPNFITDLIGIEGDFYIYRNHAYENMVSKKDAEKAHRPVVRGGRDIHFHNLGKQRMSEAILALEYPIMTIADSQGRENPQVIMILPVEGSNGAPLYAALSFYSDTKINGKYSKRPHIVLTISERGFSAEDGYDGYTEVINKAIKKGNVLSIDKEKTRDYLSVIANHTRVGNITSKSLTDNIAKFREYVNDFRAKNKISYKLPVSKDITDREMLVDMFAQTVTDSKEYRALENYRKHIEEMQAIEEKLDRISAEIRRLSFAEGPRDTETLNRLKLQQKQAVNRLNNYDNILLRLEKSGVLRAMIERNRKQIAQESLDRARAYYKERSERREAEIRQHYQESRRKAVERHNMAQVRQQIRKDVQRLDSLLNKGTKKRNVKLGLQEFVGAALRLAKGTFLNDYNEYDMIRNGVQNNLFPEEKAAFE